MKGVNKKMAKFGYKIYIEEGTDVRLDALAESLENICSKMNIIGPLLRASELGGVADSLEKLCSKEEEIISFINLLADIASDNQLDLPELFEFVDEALNLLFSLDQ